MFGPCYKNTLLMASGAAGEPGLDALKPAVVGYRHVSVLVQVQRLKMVAFRVRVTQPKPKNAEHLLAQVSIHKEFCRTHSFFRYLFFP